MGDAGEGLIDAESRIQERMDQLAEERAARQAGPPPDPERLRAQESLRRARADLDRQLQSVTHAARRKMLEQAIADIEKRIKKLK